MKYLMSYAWLSRRCLLVAGVFFVTLFLLQAVTSVALGQSLINLPDIFNNATKAEHLEVADIRLDGQTLFQVAAPVSDLSPDSDSTLSGIERRTNRIEFHLNQLIRNHIDSETLKVTPSTLNNQTVLIATQENRDPQFIMTVTDLDLEIDYSQQKLEELAQDRARIIEAALRQAWHQRTPEYLQQQIEPATRTLLLMLLGSLLVGVLQKWQRIQSRLLTQYQHLLDQLDAEPPVLSGPATVSTDTSAIDQPPRLGHQPKHLNFLSRLPLDIQIHMNRIAFPSLLSAQIAIWFVGSSIILQRFAQTRALSLWLVRVPIGLIAIPLGLAILRPATHAVIRHLIKAYFIHLCDRGEDELRLRQRYQTIVSVSHELFLYVFILVGILLYSYVFNVMGFAFVILAGISFLGRGVITDNLKTLFILSEDQYALEDWIEIGEISGQVERINLRSTQIRTLSQDLYTISNSCFDQVKNCTRDQSGLSMGIDVAYDTDLDKAMAVIEAVVMKLLIDPDWKDYISDKPEVRGVDAFGDNSITIRLVLVTKAGQQWMVGREFRRRLKSAFDQAGITIPFPQRSIWFENSLLQTKLQTKQD